MILEQADGKLKKIVVPGKVGDLFKKKLLHLSVSVTCHKNTIFYRLRSGLGAIALMICNKEFQASNLNQMIQIYVRRVRNRVMIQKQVFGKTLESKG